MKYSSAVIFYKDGKILAGHAAGQQHWDLPKGKVERLESFEEAAVRECYEEFNIKIKTSDIRLLGISSYQKRKKLVLFFYVGDKLPDIKDLKCHTFYVNKKGYMNSDFDKYQYIDLEDLPQYFTERMVQSIVKTIYNFYSEED